MTEEDFKEIDAFSETVGTEEEPSTEETPVVEHPCIQEMIKSRLAFEGSLINIETGEWARQPIIYQLTTGNNGQMYRSKDDAWLVLRYCPVCGESLEAGKE